MPRQSGTPKTSSGTGKGSGAPRGLTPPGASGHRGCPSGPPGRGAVGVSLEALRPRPGGTGRQRGSPSRRPEGTPGERAPAAGDPRRAGCARLWRRGKRSRAAPPSAPGPGRARTPRGGCSLGREHTGSARADRVVAGSRESRSRCGVGGRCQGTPPPRPAFFAAGLPPARVCGLEAGFRLGPGVRAAGPATRPLPDLDGSPGGLGPQSAGAWRQGGASKATAHHRGLRSLASGLGTDSRGPLPSGHAGAGGAPPELLRTDLGYGPPRLLLSLLRRLKTATVPELTPGDPGSFLPRFLTALSVLSGG